MSEHHIRNISYKSVMSHVEMDHVRRTGRIHRHTIARYNPTPDKGHTLGTIYKQTRAISSMTVLNANTHVAKRFSFASLLCL